MQQIDGGDENAGGDEMRDARGGRRRFGVARLRLLQRRDPPVPLLVGSDGLRLLRLRRVSRPALPIPHPASRIPFPDRRFTRSQRHQRMPADGQNP